MDNIKTIITQRTHPELYEPGIIITNAPYRQFFYHIDKVCDRRYNVTQLNNGGIKFEKVGG